MRPPWAPSSIPASAGDSEVVQAYKPGYAHALAARRAPGSRLDSRREWRNVEPGGQPGETLRGRRESEASGEVPDTSCAHPTSLDSLHYETFRLY